MHTTRAIYSAIYPINNYSIFYEALHGRGEKNVHNYFGQGGYNTGSRGWPAGWLAGWLAAAGNAFQPVESKPASAYGRWFVCLREKVQIPWTYSGPPALQKADVAASRFAYLCLWACRAYLSAALPACIAVPPLAKKKRLRIPLWSRDRKTSCKRASRMERSTCQLHSHGTFATFARELDRSR